MHKCNVKLKQTILHDTEECPHTEAIGYESNGNYYCVFHNPDNSTKQPISPSGFEIHKSFANEFKKYLKETESANKRGPAGTVAIDCRGFIFPFEIKIRDILDAIHSSVDFTGSVFLRGFYAQEIAVHGKAIFHGVKFHENANFFKFHVLNYNEVSFEQCIFLQDATFHEASFTGDSNFHSVQFNAWVDFRNGAIKQADFSNSIFSKDVTFQDRQFDEITKFENTQFGKSRSRDNIISVNFFNCHFRGETYFTKSKFNGSVNFDSATFHNFTNFRKVYFASAPSMIATKIEENIDFEDAKFKKGNIYTFRMLKGKMEEKRDTWQSKVFFAYEMYECWRGYNWFWRMFSLNSVFLILSYYGKWWLLPFAWLIAEIFIFAGIYSYYDGLAIKLDEELIGWEGSIIYWNGFSIALYYSINNLKFAWLFGKAIIVPKYFWVWTVSLFQSTLSVLLFALRIISIRRKFKF